MVVISGDTLTIGSESATGDGTTLIVPGDFSGTVSTGLLSAHAGFDFDIRARVEAGSPVKIVAIGSSATYGLLPTGGRAGAPWPAILQERLRAHFGVTNITVVNVGISGDNVQSLINRFTTDIVNNSPDLVIQLIGVNDTGRATYLDDLKTIAGMYRANGINVIWSTTNPVFTTGTERKNFKLTIMNHQMKELARRLGIPVIDVYDGIAECTCRSRIWTLYNAMPDSGDTHPSQEGYRIMGDLMFAGLVECYEVRREDVTTDPRHPRRVYPAYSIADVVANGMYARQVGSGDRMSVALMQYCGGSELDINYVATNSAGSARVRVNVENNVYDFSNSSTLSESKFFDIPSYPGVHIVRIDESDVTGNPVHFSGVTAYRYRAPKPYAFYTGNATNASISAGRYDNMDILLSGAWWSLSSGTYRGPYDSVWLVNFSASFNSMGRADLQVRSDTGADIGPAVFVTAPGNTVYSSMNPGSEVSCVVEGSGFQIWFEVVSGSPTLREDISSVSVHEI